MNQRLQERVGEFLGVSYDRVVLASSATAGYQGVHDLLSYRGIWGVRITDATWPGMRHVSIRRSTGAKIVILTDIGGRRFIDSTRDEPRDSNFDRPWREEVRSWNAIYIHDACHSWLPDPAADFGLVSFYPTKLVPGAEGGAVICKDPADAEALRPWLYCGLRPGGAGQGLPPSVPGRKANMTDVQAALNLEALELAPQHMAGIAEAWSNMADSAGDRGIPYRHQPIRPYLFQVETRDPENVRRRLTDRGVPSAHNFPPAPLVTVPCYPTVDYDAVLNAVEEALGW